MNAQYVYDYLTSRGVPDAAAKGITANLLQEAGGGGGNLRASVVTGTAKGDNGASSFVAQWDANRSANLQAFASSKGLDPLSLDTQLEFILEEMNPASPYKDPIAAKNRDAILNAATPADAAKAFSDYFERNASWNTQARVDKANNIDRYLNGAGQVNIAALDPASLPVPSATPFDRGSILNPAQATPVSLVGSAAAAEMPGVPGPDFQKYLQGYPTNYLPTPPSLPPAAVSPVDRQPLPPVQSAPATPLTSPSGPLTRPNNAPTPTPVMGDPFTGEQYFPTTLEDYSKGIANAGPNLDTIWDTLKSSLLGTPSPAPTMTADQGASQLGQTFQDFFASPDAIAPVAPAGGQTPTSAPVASVSSGGPTSRPNNKPAPTIGQVMEAKTSLNVTDQEYAAQLAAAGLSPSEVSMAVAARAAAAPPAAPVAPPAAAAPAPVPVQGATPQRAPVATPGAAPGGMAAAPTPPPPASGQDVWSGQARSGMATDGSTLSRNPDGSVSRYSQQYDRWDTFNPQLQQWLPGGPTGSVGVPGPIGNTMSSVGKTIGDTVGNVKDSFGKMDGATMAKRGLGSVIGSALMGPVGAIIGGLAAPSLFKGSGAQAAGVGPQMTGTTAIGSPGQYGSPYTDDTSSSANPNQMYYSSSYQNDSGPGSRGQAISEALAYGYSQSEAEQIASSLGF